MNARMAKKIRKYSKRNWMEYYTAIRQWPFGTRLHFCWNVLFGMRTRKPKKASKKQVLSQRRPLPAH